MKVIPLDRILEIRQEIDYTDNPIELILNKNYRMSNKLTKLNKKKHILNKINFDIVYQNFEVSKFDNKFKNILMSFNKLSKDNLFNVLDNLKNIVIDDYVLLEKVSDFLCKKAINELSFSDLYIKLINELSKVNKWLVKYNNTYIINLKEGILIQLQRLFEEELLKFDKEYGILFFKFINKIYISEWINDTIFESLIFHLLENDKNEFLIILLKNSNFSKKEEYRKILLGKQLPMRLRFLLEEI